MDEVICQQCGTRNEPGTEFCVECQSYLSWTETRETSLAQLQADAATGTDPAPATDPATVAATDPTPTPTATPTPTPTPTVGGFPTRTSVGVPAGWTPSVRVS